MSNLISLGIADSRLVDINYTEQYLKDSKLKISLNKTTHPAVTLKLINRYPEIAYLLNDNSIKYLYSICIIKKFDMYGYYTCEEISRTKFINLICEAAKMAELLKIDIKENINTWLNRTLKLIL